MMEQIELEHVGIDSLLHVKGRGRYNAFVIRKDDGRGEFVDRIYADGACVHIVMGTERVMIPYPQVRYMIEAKAKAAVVTHEPVRRGPGRPRKIA